MAKDVVIEMSRKQVIENKLLAALDDKSKVACIFAVEDLDILISALSVCLAEKNSSRQREMMKDLITLRTSAFGS